MTDNSLIFLFTHSKTKKCSRTVEPYSYHLSFYIIFVILFTFKTL